MAESDGCWTCIQYCCPNVRWSYEECGYAPDINKFSIEELCEDNMCDKDSLYWAEKKACYTCENGIPEHGYAWGKREYDTENGYFLCDFKCDDGYEKVPRGTQSNGFMDWDGYCKLKEALACPEGYFESGGKCVKKQILRKLYAMNGAALIISIQAEHAEMIPMLRRYAGKMLCPGKA